MAKIADKAAKGKNIDSVRNSAVKAKKSRSKLSKGKLSNNKRIDQLVGQLNDIAKIHFEFMSIFPPLADQIVPELSHYLGEANCIKLSNDDETFSFDEDYGHQGLGIEGDRFRIPLMIRIRDNDDNDDKDAELEDGALAEQEKSFDEKPLRPSKKKGKRKIKPSKKVKSGEKAEKEKKGKKSKIKKSKIKAQEITKPKSKKSALKKKAKATSKKSTKSKQPKTAAQAKQPETKQNETLLRFKLLCEQQGDKLIIDIAGTKKVILDPDDLEPLYEAIFAYLADYFSVEKFFGSGQKSYQNASYGFFRAQF